MKPINLHRLNENTAIEVNNVDEYIELFTSLVDNLPDDPTSSDIDNIVRQIDSTGINSEYATRLSSFLISNMKFNQAVSKVSGIDPNNLDPKDFEDL